MKLVTACLSSSAQWDGSSFSALDSPQTLLLLFGASDLIDQPDTIRNVLAACPQSQVIGCSTSGEIHGTHIIDNHLVAAAVRFEHSQLRTARATVSGPAESYAAGSAVAAQLQGPSLKAVFVLSDGLSVNGSELVKGMNDVLKGSAVITGGLAGDGARFKRTWVIMDRTPQSGYVTAVGFYGDRLTVGHGSKSGWDKFGPERRVTKSAGNVLYELDGRPALELYKEYLAERAAGLPATALLFPLALRAAKDDEKSLVRTVLGVDEATHSLTFAGDIPQGALAQLMRANFDRLVAGASEAASLTHRSQTSPYASGPTLAVAISCVGRRLVLGERTEEETEAALDMLPQGSQQIGFYSYGEISPYSGGPCDLHNQTMTLTTLAEA